MRRREDNEMSKKYLIVDQNYMRSHELVSVIDNNPDVKFILPDASLMEMCKKPEWESTLMASLRSLSKCPERVFLSMSIGEAIRWETKERTSIGGRLLPKEFTDFIRDLLSDIARDQQGNSVQIIAGKIASAQAGWATDEFDHVKNKERVFAFVKKLSDSLTDEFKKWLRSKSLSKGELLPAIKEGGLAAMESYCAREGISNKGLRSLVKSRSAMLRLVYLRLWLGFFWIANGGIENVADNKVTNDLVDHDYVITATFFDGVLSKENRVNEAYADLNIIFS